MVFFPTPASWHPVLLVRLRELEVLPQLLKLRDVVQVGEVVHLLTKLGVAELAVQRVQVEVPPARFFARELHVDLLSHQGFDTTPITLRASRARWGWRLESQGTARSISQIPIVNRNPTVY